MSGPEAFRLVVLPQLFRVVYYPITNQMIFSVLMTALGLTVGLDTDLAGVTQPGDAVILDNLGSHKGKGVRKAIRDVGARLVFLPKYSPDLNPIEQVFAKFKTLLRKAEARSYEAISDASGKIAQYPPAECAAYLKNAGYG
jgi:transposase